MRAAHRRIVGVVVYSQQGSTDYAPEVPRSARRLETKAGLWLPYFWGRRVCAVAAQCLRERKPISAFRKATLHCSILDIRFANKN